MHINLRETAIVKELNLIIYTFLSHLSFHQGTFDQGIFFYKKEKRFRNELFFSLKFKGSCCTEWSRCNSFAGRRMQAACTDECVWVWGPCICIYIAPFFRWDNGWCYSALPWCKIHAEWKQHCSLYKKALGLDEHLPHAFTISTTGLRGDILVSFKLSQQACLLRLPPFLKKTHLRLQQKEMTQFEFPVH